MRRGVRAGLVFGLLVFLPTVHLAVWAWRAAELGYREALQSQRLVSEGLARRSALEIEEVVRRAADRARSSRAVAYAAEGKWVGWSPLPAAVALRRAAAAPPAAEEERSYLLSRRGGESFEALCDPARAVDAYSFYLPRIRAPALRGRLRFAAARAARAAGREPLARALWRELFADGSGLATEEGWPVDLSAAAMLLEDPEARGGSLKTAARERLAAAAGDLSTPLLARLAAAIAPEDAALRELVDERRQIEIAVRACPDLLSSREAALVEGLLVVTGQEDTEGRPVRTLRAARCVLPDPAGASAGAGYNWSYDWSPILDARGPDPSSAEGVVSSPVRLGEGGPILGFVTARGDGHAAAESAVVQRRTIQALVSVQVVLVAAGGIALFAFVRRERQYARLRERLLANVSHELKTPVTSVRMFAEMLAQPTLDPAEAGGFRDHLRRESARLSQLLENLLDLSRPDRAERELEKEPVDLDALVKEIADGFAHRAREEGVEFRAEGLEAPTGPVLLETSPSAVERIVLNLLDNALKYRRETGGRVVLRLEVGGETVRVSVEDNGRGIARRDRERVFEEFYRARYDDYAVKGAGLGLSIARRLARRLGGDLELQSREGEGSIFTLLLPRGVLSREVPRAGSGKP